jgi:hypothetical protein
MKKSILILLLFQLFFYSGFTQVVDSAAVVDTAVAVDSAVVIDILNTTKYFKKLDSNFRFNEFSFNSKWESINHSVTEINEDEDMDEYLSNNMTNKKIFLISKYKKFDGFIYDKIYLKFSINRFSYTNYVFVKEFTNIDSSLKFYEELSKHYFKIKNFNDFSDTYSEAGKKIFILTKIENNKVYLSISETKNSSPNTIKESYDYYNLSYQFKEIDNDFSYRGIKFGTSLSLIQNSTKLLPYTRKGGSRYTYLPTDSKYLFWKSFELKPGDCFFYFSDKFKLSNVSLAIDCNNDLQYNEIKNKLISILGNYSYGYFNSINWVGKNIEISIPSKRDKDLDYIHIMISSKKHYRASEKDF